MLITAVDIVIVTRVSRASTSHTWFVSERKLFTIENVSCLFETQNIIIPVSVYSEKEGFLDMLAKLFI
jgi:hypothetical protein